MRIRITIEGELDLVEKDLGLDLKAKTVDEIKSLLQQDLDNSGSVGTIANVELIG